MRSSIPWSRRRWLLTSTTWPGVLWAVASCRDEQFACDQVTGLSPQDLLIRQNLAYQDRSTHAEQNCANCQQWLPASKSGQCGGCKIMPGPVHPEGFCKVWAKQG